MENIKVAVLGSCATRDNFNSRFNPDYKEFYDCILTQNQASIISLMSSPLHYTKDDIGELNDYDRWNVETDLSKSFLDDLVVLQPAYLIIDFFADIHFGVISVAADQYITNNRWKLWKTPYYKELKDQGTIKRLTVLEHTEEYLRVWKRSINQLFAFLKEKLPECHVIIHKARNVSALANDGVLVDLATSGRVKKENVQLLNQFWAELDQYVIDHFPVSVIEVNDKLYYTYNEHPWGPFYVHYSEDYYHKFLLKLHRVVLENQIEDHVINKISANIFKQYDDLMKKNEELNRNLVNEMKVSAGLQEEIKPVDDKQESIIAYFKRRIKFNNRKMP